MQVMNIARRSKFASSAAVLIRAQNQRRNFDALLMKQLFDEQLYHPEVNALPPHFISLQKIRHCIFRL